MYLLKGVGKAFWDGRELIQVFNNINLEILPGEMISVVGPSGCGKSTFLSILGMLDYQTSGQIYLNGTDISIMNEKARTKLRRDNIGYVLQNNYLVGFLTAFENVMFPLIMKGYTYHMAKKNAADALDKVGISVQVQRNYPNLLSGGEKQRISIARVLAASPQIILADEPTGNLDANSAEQVFGAISNLNKDGICVVMATHNPELSRRFPRIFAFDDYGIEVIQNKRERST